METFASKKILEALVPTFHQTWGSQRITGGPGLASARDVPGGRRPVFPDLWLQVPLQIWLGHQALILLPPEPSGWVIPARRSRPWDLA